MRVRFSPSAPDIDLFLPFVILPLMSVERKIIVGLVGEKGGGKETFVQYLKTISPLSIGHFRSSDILAETLDLWNIPKTRINLQDLAITMNNQYGLGSLTKAMENRLLKSSAVVSIVDGIRWETDETMIRSFSENYLIYITATPETRYKRLKERSEKVGEKGLSWEQFMSEEQKKTEIYIPGIGLRADFRIENNSLLEEFTKQIQEFCSKHLTHKLP